MLGWHLFHCSLLCPSIFSSAITNEYHFGNFFCHLPSLFCLGSCTHPKLGPGEEGLGFWMGTATKAKQRWRVTETIVKNGIHLWLLSWKSMGRVRNSEINAILALYLGCGDVIQMLYRMCFECRLLLSVPCHFALPASKTHSWATYLRSEFWGEGVSRPGVSLLL